MSDIITLNVGGTIYTTSRTTLTRYPSSMLGCMFSDRLPSAMDNHGNFVIDRDGNLFRHVLNFLRTSKLTLPENFNEYELLEAEADFYQIPELNAALQSKINDMGKKNKSNVVVEKRLLKLNNTQAWDWKIYGNCQTILNLHDELVGGRDFHTQDECYGFYHYTEGEDVESGKLRIKQYKFVQGLSGYSSNMGSRFSPEAKRSDLGFYRVLNIKLWRLGYRMHDIKPDVSELELAELDTPNIQVEPGKTYYFEPASMCVDFQM